MLLPQLWGAWALRCGQLLSPEPTGLMLDKGMGPGALQLGPGLVIVPTYRGAGASPPHGWGVGRSRWRQRDCQLAQASLTQPVGCPWLPTSPPSEGFPSLPSSDPARPSQLLRGASGPGSPCNPL